MALQFAQSRIMLEHPAAAEALFLPIQIRPAQAAEHAAAAAEPEDMLSFTRERVISIISELGTILCKYRENKDPLSEDLKETGSNFINYVIDNLDARANVNLNTLLVNCINKIEEIRTKLLNPLHPPRPGTLFQDPWLTGGTQTLEKQNAEEYVQDAFDIDDEVLSLESHELAKEVLHWLIHLPEYRLEFVEAGPALLQEPVPAASHVVINRPAKSEELIRCKRYKSYTSLVSKTLINREQAVARRDLEEQRLRMQEQKRIEKAQKIHIHIDENGNHK